MGLNNAPRGMKPEIMRNMQLGVHSTVVTSVAARTNQAKRSWMSCSRSISAMLKVPNGTTSNLLKYSRSIMIDRPRIGLLRIL